MLTLADKKTKWRRKVVKCYDLQIDPQKASEKSLPVN